MSDLTQQLEPNLCLASNGLELAHSVIAALESAPEVRLDFSFVRRMTPSFANSFVMTLLERFSVEQLRSRLKIENRNESVLRSMNESVHRYLSGFRLSTQMPNLAST